MVRKILDYQKLARATNDYKLQVQEAVSQIKSNNG
jgi:hypothetical protein